jgi:hypothetical protein
MSEEVPITGANPLGAAGDVTKAAARIKELGLASPKPQGQSEAKAETAKANPGDPAKPVPAATKPKDPATGRFTKAEPEGTEPEAAKPEATAETPEASDDSEELPDRIEKLAEAIGVDPEKFLDHIKAEAKINGESREVNLRELIAGYQKGEDYSRKTAEIAEQRKAAEAERTAYQQQREALSQRLEPLIGHLEAQQQNDAVLIQKAFEQGDYQEAARLQFLSQQRQAQLDQANEAKARADGERQRETEIQRHNYVAEQERLLLEAKPVWAKDVEKGKKDLAAIRDYLKSEGIPAQQADTLHEAKALLLAEKAMLWDNLQKNTKPAALQEVKSKPKFQPPGAAKAPVDPKKEQLRASLKQLRKTGSVKDAARAFKAMRIVTPV